MSVHNIHIAHLNQNNSIRVNASEGYPQFLALAQYRGLPCRPLRSQVCDTTGAAKIKDQETEVVVPYKDRSRSGERFFETSRDRSLK